MSFDTIPVFKASQVLTADQLNDLREFLDQEDKLTRRALIGIGVLCGFIPDVDESGRVLLSKGVAVTSAGFVIAEPAVVCDRIRPYEVPVPTGEEVPPQVAAEARYPFMFPDGETQIPAWEMLTTEVEIPEGEPEPDELDTAFLADKTVMLFLECTEESLRNCDINDCSDKGAELQFVVRRLLIRRGDADGMMAREAEIAGFPTDKATHPGLQLPHLRVEDLGLARNGISTFPALLARIFQIALRLSSELPPALNAAWAAYGHLLGDMYPEDELPGGPFPPNYFGNVWAQFLAQPYLAQYFFDYILDATLAYNEFVEAARLFDAECLPNPDRFPKHVLLGDPVPRARGYVAEVSTPAEFAAYDPGAASSGFGPHPRPPFRRTPWTPARPGAALQDLRALFHRLTLLAHAFHPRPLLSSEIRVTPSRHDAWPLSERCIPPYYAFDASSDLFRVWSPRKTRSNLLSTVYAHGFSTRDGNHPYFFRIDGETFHAVAGHVGKDLAQAMSELIEHKRVLGLDFAIEPVWMGLSLPNDADGQQTDEQSAARAMQAARKLLLCRMGDFEVILLGLLAALFALLAWILRSVARQPVTLHAVALAAAPEPAPAATQPAPAGSEITFGDRVLDARDMENLVALARAETARATSAFSRMDLALDPGERQELKRVTETLRTDLRTGVASRGDATLALSGGAGQGSLATFYLDVKDGGGELFDRVKSRVSEMRLDTDDARAAAGVYNAVALMDATERVMARASVGSLAELDPADFETDYLDFAGKLSAYAAAAPSRAPQVDAEVAASNVAIADTATAVAAIAPVFGSTGLFGAVQERMRAVFADLTLAGYAQRHPGLEHRAGVPAGGTLVLAYASKRELLELVRRAGGRLDRLSARAAPTALPGISGAIAEATEELLREAGPIGDDPLTEFVVLADFCLPSNCCDSDCSDVMFEGRERPAIFDLRESGSMAVDPILPNGVEAPPRPTRPVDDEIESLVRELGIGPRTGRGEISALRDAERRAREAAAAASEAEAARERAARAAEAAAEEAAVRARVAAEAAERARAAEADRAAEAARAAEEARRAEAERARLAAEAERHAAEAEAARAEAAERAADAARRAEEEARRETERAENERREAEERAEETGERPRRALTGVVTGAGAASRTPISNAVVRIADRATGTEIRVIRARSDGSFTERLPQGDFILTAEAEGFAGRPVEISLREEDAEVALRMTRARPRRDDRR